jgi:hypothetical protein
MTELCNNIILHNLMMCCIERGIFNVFIGKTTKDIKMIELCHWLGVLYVIKDSLFVCFYVLVIFKYVSCSIVQSDYVIIMHSIDVSRLFCSFLHFFRVLPISNTFRPPPLFKDTEKELVLLSSDSIRRYVVFRSYIWQLSPQKIGT